MVKKVVLGFLGITLDAGTTEQRWTRWRPTVSLNAHSEFSVDCIEMLVGNECHLPLANSIKDDILSMPARLQCNVTKVNINKLDIRDPWNFQEVYSALHEFAKSYDFKDDVEYYIHLTTGTHVAQICLFLLTEARYFPAKLLQTSFGNREVLDADRWRGHLEVIDLDLSTYDKIARRFNKESQDSQDLLKGGIVTRNVAFNTMIERIERVALKSSAPILLNGPTGSGKSKLAQRIFELRTRRHLVNGSFIEVNCATLRGDNAMSALFGHKKGAFTGAAGDRAGLLKSADKGILFLDEIGELGLDEQAMLLRALEDKRFTPMGSDKDVSSDFQLLAGTNRDLRNEVIAGRFRADLLARINVWQFTLPGLADRHEDIEPNLDFEIERAGKDLGLHISITKEARTAFMDFAVTAPWHGNFRDLSSAVTRMATLADAGRIGIDDVKYECINMNSSWGIRVDHKIQFNNDTNECINSSDLIKQFIPEDIDKFDLAQIEVVLRAIHQTDSMAAAGRMLFATSRMDKDKPNDSDRVRKFLSKWNLDYHSLKI